MTKSFNRNINSLLSLSVILLTLLLSTIDGFSQQRFPKPEFESGHSQPPTFNPSPRAEFMEIVDVAVLILSLTIITWLILKKRSRRGVFWMSIFSILYFGFYRMGCVCSVGSIQNVTLALFHPEYQIPVTVIAFFVIPLIYTLFYGRTFCAGICPLGAIQDLVALKPMSLKSWVEKTLGLFPFIYLALAILYAATATDFIICRYDPFIGIYRLDGLFSTYSLGGIFLIAGVFIARPYCRFFCPYGVLLNLASQFSRKHLTITPTECIQCKLCENSCPYGAIETPVPAQPKEERTKSVKRLIVFSLALPLLILIGGYTGARFHETLAKVNPKVRLAQNMISFEASNVNEIPIEIEAFRTSGKPVEELYTEAASIINDFYTGGWILGGFIGLVFGLTLFGLSRYHYREDYEPNKGTCLSCGRCMDYCPVEKIN
ncbi:MAG: 4Fe-4S binding protein [Bacteroidales bacterium]|nr:4Fe-4S binding protein [Bacteroidales bacterium]